MSVAPNEPSTFGTTLGWNVFRASSTRSADCSEASCWFSIRSFLASASLTACSSVRTGLCADTVTVVALMARRAYSVRLLRMGAAPENERRIALLPRQVHLRVVEAGAVD